MYEYAQSGLGAWGTIGWWSRWTGPCNCASNGGLAAHGNRTNSVCFDESPESLVLANRHGCTRGQYEGGRQTVCDLPNGHQGNCWCCPPTYPRAYEDGSDITPEERLYQQQQEQALNTEPVAPDPGNLPQDQGGSRPAPVQPISFARKLLHPGAIAAIVVVGLSAFLVKRTLENR